MKTNPSARVIVRIRGVLICLAVIGMVGLAFNLGGSLSSRVGQYPAARSESPQAPNMTFGDMMAAATLVR